MNLLDGAARSYAWGSRTALAELRGVPAPTRHPEAEMWFGAHPGDPAQLRTPGGAVSLLDAIDSDPGSLLGPTVVDRFGDRLPFLVKFLAAEEPLSLQAHPSLDQAREGFRRENAAGVPVDAPTRNYRDASHKPELVVALTEFDALAGFRTPSKTVELFRLIGADELRPYADMLDGQPDASGLRTLFTSWITLPQRALDTLLPAVIDACVRALERADDTGDRTFVPELRTVLELGEYYPGDAGVLAALLLNRVTLQPGEALYLDAGNLHAYLRGTAVEIMANSDNVLRGGLTPKHVDVPELLRVLDFEPLASPILESETGDDGTVLYPTPAPEFALIAIGLTATTDGGRPRVLGHAGDPAPRIVLCVDGRVQISSGDTVLIMERGSAVWIAASDPDPSLCAISDSARVFVAGVGR
ncbi:mannose-6-phosphate isomerase [Rhodococcus sp. Leaf7]|uniref:mannose-6-phosphate isomerase, class I n=1 Tax=unclassified Rhodococcus (in: high G+C Gram-positive bacteria) TaxID=192944 RepID=UPI0006FD0FA2|nr:MULTISPECIES: mannose-6-phosphate isomerase, class I [unclassified Rhodococcus (in: high G+C Gram-positive bacteria)]KQU06284.1 mannose-6-phosphate isomerase [Rhodococcus sp. Leaf7]KQU41801.1 mannose-6-phosphate isomerase [Rhodococcus sp. Leaf247]